MDFNLLNNTIVKISEKNPLLLTSSLELRDGDIHLSASETQHVEPGHKVTWFVSGNEGVDVVVSLERVEGSGGHKHPNEGDSPILGSVHPKEFRITGKYPQNIRVTFNAPKISGTIMQKVIFDNGSVDTDFNVVSVPKLVEFTGGTGIVLTGSTLGHPRNHFGLRSLNSKILALGEGFYKEYGKNLFVNDMSLEGGGLFDINNNWQRPHRTHRDGRRVDMNSTSMSESEKEFFRALAQRLGFRRVLLEKNPEHWHLEI